MLPLFEHIDPIPSPVEVLLKKEYQHTIVRYRKDGIIHVTYKLDSIITVEDCYAMAKFISKIGVAEKYVFLTEPQQDSNIDDAARTLLASDKGNRYTSRNAILCSSIIHEMVGNFFIRMDNPTIPTKLFKDKAKAIEWLLYSASGKMVS